MGQNLLSIRAGSLSGGLRRASTLTPLGHWFTSAIDWLWNLGQTSLWALSSSW